MACGAHVPRHPANPGDVSSKARRMVARHSQYTNHSWVVVGLTRRLLLTVTAPPLLLLLLEVAEGCWANGQRKRV